MEYLQRVAEAFVAANGLPRTQNGAAVREKRRARSRNEKVIRGSVQALRLIFCEGPIRTPISRLETTVLGSPEPTAIF
jgi:hypothetical protein